MSRKRKKAEFKPILSDVDVMLLQEGVQPGANRDETEKARQALEAKTEFTLVKKTDYQATVTASKKGRKRGPKPTASKNVTEDDERQRLETIRRLIGEQGKTLKKAPLLRATLDLLRIFRARCESGIFLRHDERAMLCSLLRDHFGTAEFLEAKLANGDLALGYGWIDLPSRGEIANWLEELLDDCWENAIKQTWQMFVDELPLVIVKLGVQNTLSERDLYNQIRIVLNLKSDSGKTSEHTQRLTAGTGEESTAVDADFSPENEQDCGHHQNRSVPETLRAAGAALSMFRQIIDDCWFCRINLGSENLYTLIHALSISNPAGSLPMIVEELNGLFMASLARQRKHPFPMLANEEVRFGAAEIPEDGQIGAF